MAADGVQLPEVGAFGTIEVGTIGIACGIEYALERALAAVPALDHFIKARSDCRDYPVNFVHHSPSRRDAFARAAVSRLLINLTPRLHAG